MPAGQGHLHVDHHPLSLLQERFASLEELRPTQPIAEQVFR